MFFRRFVLAVLTALLLSTSGCASEIKHANSSIPLAKHISWAVDESQWKPLQGDNAPLLSKAELDKHLGEQLNDPYSWGAAGITFDLVQDLKKATIVIVPRRELSDSGCDPLSSGGCTSVTDGKTCVIQLLVAAGPWGSGILWKEGALNHEMGHCLGYDHADQGVMHEKMGDSTFHPFPSVGLIEDLKKRLAQAPAPTQTE